MKWGDAVEWPLSTEKLDFHHSLTDDLLALGPGVWCTSIPYFISSGNNTACSVVVAILYKADDCDALGT